MKIKKFYFSCQVDDTIEVYFLLGIFWGLRSEWVNPILTGLFESKFLLGGGVNLTPPSDLGPKGPIAAKFCTDVKTHVKSTATTFFWRKIVYLLCYYDLCKLDA